ncbi:MAG: hypothetical protein JHD33_07695 [Chthoniobacterales bacterium]|nr:hypothetical protein [Chthoniobacterales bacterium]
MNKTTNPAAIAAAQGRCVVSFRTQRDNRNHHLWLNNGSWWLHYTVHLPDYTKTRVRRSLRTSDVKVARAQRDAILGEFGLYAKEAA